MSQLRTALVLAICGLAAGLAGCQRKPSTPATASVPGGQLWRIEVQQDGKVVGQQDICADQAVRASFERPAPEVNGKPCVRVGQAVETGATYAVRCNIDNQQFRVGSVTKGDPARDFTVEMAVAAQGRTGPGFEQVRRYRLLGACPPGWAIADTAAPGAAQATNALTGVAHPTNTPAP